MLLLSLFMQDGEGLKSKPVAPIAKKIDVLEKELSEKNRILAENGKYINDLQQKLKAQQVLQSAYEESNAGKLPEINITGLAGINSANSWFVQWKVYSSPACSVCQPFKRNLKARLNSFVVSSDASTNPQILIVEISDAKWVESGWRLPHLELYSNGAKVYECDGDQITFDEIGIKWNDEYNKGKAAASQLMGMKVGTIEARPQVEQLLKSLQPFLDGGTLTISYKPRPGVVKDYLTINQGTVALRIPANTSITLSMDNSKLAGVFAQPSPQVKIPIRGNTNVKSMTLSPSLFAIQLPWMIDPEIAIVNPKGYSVSAPPETPTPLPQMELDEMVDDDDDTLLGEPRSGHWPTVRKAFVKLHPVCSACGSNKNLNVHHVVPFHIRKELECDPNNLITLCRDCHFHIGHHENWKNSNPLVREEAAEHLKSVK